MNNINNLEKSTQLSVAYVEFGGNTGEYQYFFAYSTPSLIVREPNTKINITLTKSTAEQFVISDYLSSDTENDIVQISKTDKSLQIIDKNSKTQLISFSILIYDKQRDYYFSCDPQVLNSPDPD